jgi:predicted MFS family arabinose efflux permease
VFYINLPFGVLALLVIALAYPPRRETTKVQVDWAGAALMFAGVSALLLALSGETGASPVWLLASIVLLTAFAYVERRVPQPILPLDLFRMPLIARTNIVAFLFGAAMFGAIAFIPLYIQGVLGATATQAGQVLTPLFLGWVTTSIIAARLTVRLGYRSISMAGSVLLTSGFVVLSTLTPESSRLQLLGACLLMGLGMGCSMLSLLLAVQHGATSLNQFSRSIGASVGVAAMGALMARALAGATLPTGGAPGASAVALTGPFRLQFAAALDQVFWLGTAIAVLALVVTFFLPPVDFPRGVPASAGEQMLAAEMATLEPQDEPVAVPD